MSDCSTAVEYCDNKYFIFKTDDVDSLKQKIVQYEKKYIKIKCDYQKILENNQIINPVGVATLIALPKTKIVLSSTLLIKTFPN